MKPKYEIGQKIKHGKCYPMTCHERFVDIWLDEDLRVVGRAANPLPLAQNGEGIIVGLKMAIMSEYKYTPSNTTQGFEDAYPNTVPAYATGKREECLVCVKNIKKFKPYLVRKIDIIL